MPNDDNDWMRNYGRYSTMAFQMIATVLLGLFLGIKLDKWLDMKKPVFLIILLILSGVAAFYFAFKDFLKKN